MNLAADSSILTPCPVSISLTSSNGCTINVIGQADCGTGANFTDTFTFGGPGGCAHLSMDLWMRSPENSHIGISFVGGTNFCNSSALSFSGNGSSVALNDAVSLMNLNQAAILSKIKSDLVC